MWDEDLLRIGGDADLWFGDVNAYGLFMYGRNDNSIATRARPAGTGEALSFTGGFAQVDRHVRDELALTMRFNAASQPSRADRNVKETLTSFFPGVQVWIWRRLKLSFEYGFLNKSDTGRDNFGAVQAEIAF